MKITTEAELDLFYFKAKHCFQSGDKFWIMVVDCRNMPDESVRKKEQNDCYWAFNTKLAEFFNEADITYGYHKLPYTKERVHEINKAVFDIETTTTLSAKDFSEYMDKLNIFWHDKTRGFFNF